MKYVSTCWALQASSQHTVLQKVPEFPDLLFPFRRINKLQCLVALKAFWATFTDYRLFYQIPPWLLSKRVRFTWDTDLKSSDSDRAVSFPLKNCFSICDLQHAFTGDTGKAWKGFDAETALSFVSAVRCSTWLLQKVNLLLKVSQCPLGQLLLDFNAILYHGYEKQ